MLVEQIACSQYFRNKSEKKVDQVRSSGKSIEADMHHSHHIGIYTSEEASAPDDLDSYFHRAWIISQPCGSTAGTPNNDKERNRAPGLGWRNQDKKDREESSLWHIVF
eukprot:1151487-Pelagomonas_calceolata.AAC.4